MELVALVAIAVVILAVIGVIIENKKMDAKAAAYSDSINEVKRSLLTGSDRASMPILNPSEYGYRVVGKENLLAVQDDATRMEMKSTGRYRTGGASLSIPVVKGVRYRIGSGTIRGEKEWQATGHGRLIVTDKALSFESSEKNERITWTQISDVEVLMDGFRIAKRTGPPRTYTVARPDPKFAAVVEVMLSRVE